MSPQTGPDLVSAGYPIGNALSALLGGTTNTVNPNVPVKSNLYLSGLGSLLDSASAGAPGSVVSIAVPVTPGDVISKISFVTGATATSTLVNQWAALYTGTGSAPGTTGAQPALISQTASAASVAASSLLTFTFSAPVTISSLHAPYGYVYASFHGSATTNPSFISAALASAGTYPWFTTSPIALAGVHNQNDAATVHTATAPSSMSVVTRAQTAPVVLLY